MNQVEVIEPTRARGQQNFNQNQKRKVAAYCRVSTDSDEQLGSYKSQKTHYENMIANNENWELVDIYSDFAKSGTGTKNRPEFLRMISDAENGLIDLIITKSISRFARNTLDTVGYARSLKQKGIEILFESENIKTLSSESESMLAILSSVAQSESESVSKNTKAGLKMKAKQGKVIGFSSCVGYRFNTETKKIEIEEKMAEVVRLIFDLYTGGLGTYQISKELKRREIKTLKGKDNWSTSTISDILKNEKYVGDLLTGKTYTLDAISKKRCQNLGEEAMFLVKDNHEPIVSREVFEKAQEILSKRVKNENKQDKKYSMEYPFSSIMTCQYCGNSYIRCNRKIKAGYVKTWKCKTVVKKSKACCPYSKNFDEKVLEDIFIKVFNSWSNKSNDLIVEFLGNLENSQDYKDYQKSMKILKEDIKKLKNNKNKLVDLLLEEKIDKDEYDRRFIEIESKETTLQNQLKEIEETSEVGNNLQTKLKKIKKVFENNQKMETFDADIFKEIVERVEIGGFDSDGNPKPHTINFILKSGTQVYVNPKAELHHTDQTRRSGGFS